MFSAVACKREQVGLQDNRQRILQRRGKDDAPFELRTQPIKLAVDRSGQNVDREQALLRASRALCVSVDPHTSHTKCVQVGRKACLSEISSAIQHIVSRKSSEVGQLKLASLLLITIRSLLLRVGLGASLAARVEGIVCLGGRPRQVPLRVLLPSFN